MYGSPAKCETRAGILLQYKHNYLHLLIPSKLNFRAELIFIVEIIPSKLNFSAELVFIWKIIATPFIKLLQILILDLIRGIWIISLLNCLFNYQ